MGRGEARGGVGGGRCCGVGCRAWSRRVVVVGGASIALGRIGNRWTMILFLGPRVSFLSHFSFLSFS